MHSTRNHDIKNKALLGFILAVVCLFVPMLIFYDKNPNGKEETSNILFIGCTIEFSLFSLTFFLMGRYFWRKANQPNKIIQNMDKSSGIEFQIKIQAMSDYDLCYVYEHYIDKKDSNRSEIVAVEMRNRNLLGEKLFENRQELYIFEETNTLQYGGDVRVAEQYIFVEPMTYSLDPLLIHNDTMDSVVISKQKLLVKKTKIEIKFQRKTFRDKIIIFTEHLDQWLTLFKRCNVPVEDKR